MYLKNTLCSIKQTNKQANRKPDSEWVKPKNFLGDPDQKKKKKASYLQSSKKISSLASDFPTATSNVRRQWNNTTKVWAKESTFKNIIPSQDLTLAQGQKINITKYERTCHIMPMQPMFSRNTCYQKISQTRDESK